MDWNEQLRDQIDWHWRTALRPRLTGLTDDEYLWEPVAGAWNVRPRDEAVTSMAAGSGPMVIDFEYPPPDPAPVTTIAWRLGHIQVGVLAMRTASHFGGPAVDYGTYDYPARAGEALERLDAAYAAWLHGVRGLGEEGLGRPCGPAEGPFAAAPMATLVLHIHREVIHHGAEIALLRDLYRARSSSSCS
jgi:hypothetical protein